MAGSRKALVFGVLCVLSALVAGQDEACLSQARANTDPQNAVGTALSNAVATSIARTFDCGLSNSPDPSAVSGLSVAVALAISESRQVGETCIADAEASTDDVARFVAETVGEEIEAGLAEGLQGEASLMTSAWIDSERPAVMSVIKNTENSRSSPLSGNGCLNLGGVAGGLPTAVELGVLIDSAVRMILRAVRCGENFSPTGQKCKYEGGTFVGQCLAPPPQRNCGREFRDCQRKGGSVKRCAAAKVQCSREVGGKSYHG